MSDSLRTLVAAAAVIAMSGCTSTVTSNTARTAKEQLLLSEAVERSLSKVNFAPLAGHDVFIDEKYLECVDKPFVLGSVRHQVMRSGARVVDAAENADVVMELRSGGVGTDTAEAYVGTPEIALPGMITIPEVRMAERLTQHGYAKLGMVLYDADTRQVLGEGGMSLAQSDDNNWFVFGVGPFQNGSLKHNVQEAKRSTPGMNRRRMPTMVAFDTRNMTSPEGVEEPDVQFAAQEKEVE